jgi:hypothetical protein
MHRLTELEDDVVGDVDDRADAALPRAPQTLAQPERRWPRVIDIDEDTMVEPRTGRPGGERDRRRLPRTRSRRGALDGSRDRRAVRAAEGGTGEGGDLAGKPLHRHRIAAVRRDRELQHRLVEVEDRTDIGAQGRICRKFEDAVGDFGEAELFGRAQHAGGFHTAQFGGLDLEVTGQHRPDLRKRRAQPGSGVGCPADDLHLRATDRHATDLQLVGLRMSFSREDLGDHDAAEGRRRGHDRLELETCEGHAIAQLARRETGVDPSFQPGQRQLHAAPN